MKYLTLKNAVHQNIFSFLDVLKFFPDEKPPSVKTQLFRFVRKKQITKIKRGLYAFNSEHVDELALASKLYVPSYISLETALNYYGIIPDIPAGVTSVTTTTTKHLKNGFGSFHYLRIKPQLFWGYKSISLPDHQACFMADKEKALLDFFYIRRVKNATSLRLNLSGLDAAKYRRFASEYPRWIATVIINI